MSATDRIQIASDSKIGFGVQTGKGVYTTANKDFRWLPFTGASFGTTQPVANLPLEAGGDLTPRGGYKSGIWAQGPIQIIPRFVDDLGFMLVGAMGQDLYVPAGAGSGKAFGRPREVYSASTITFTAGHILDSASGLGAFVVGDVIKVTGCVVNLNKILTVTVAAAGDLTVTGGAEVEAGPITPTLTLQSAVDQTAVGSNIHTFTYKAKQSDIPYYMVRRLVEGPSPLGEEAVDARIGSMELTLPSVGPMSCSIELAGRTPASRYLLYDDPLNSVAGANGKGDWYDAGLNGYDDDTAFGLSVDPNSIVRIAGGEIPCTGAVVSVVNNLQQADAGRIVGDSTPLDFPVLNRVMTIRASLFMQDDYIYRQIFAGGAAKTDRKFSSKTYKGDIDYRAYSPTGIAGALTNQYALQVLTSQTNVVWGLQGPVDVRPGQPLALTLIGTVQTPASGNYAQIRIQNAITSTYPYTA